MFRMMRSLLPSIYNSQPYQVPIKLGGPASGGQNAGGFPGALAGQPGYYGGYTPPNASGGDIVQREVPSPIIPPERGNDVIPGGGYGMGSLPTGGFMGGQPGYPGSIPNPDFVNGIGPAPRYSSLGNIYRRFNIA